MNRKAKQQKQSAGAVPPVVKSRPRTRTEPGTRMSVLISNPDYLLEGFAEKRCKYIGVLDNIATSENLNDRNFLLKSLDSNRNSGKLPWRLGLENEVTVTISAFNLKIIKEDRTGSVLCRIAIHEIASCCYVNDDDQHLLFLRAGDSGVKHCPVHVLLVHKRGDAEEFCTIVREVFQLVFTEATIKQLNDSITAGERGSTVPMATRRTPTKGGGGGGGGGGRQQVKHSEKQSHKEEKEEEEDEEEEEEEGEEERDGATAEELVQQYMERLHRLLELSELREFASLLKDYRDNLPVKQFLTRLKQLYGPQRCFLIPGMRSFVPEEDRAHFEDFLAENNLPVDQSDSSAPAAPYMPHPPLSLPPGPPVLQSDLSALGKKPHPPPPRPPPSPPVVQQSDSVAMDDKPHPARPGKGERRRKHGGGARVADLDQFLADIDTHAENMMDSSNF